MTFKRPHNHCMEAMGFVTYLGLVLVGANAEPSKKMQIVVDSGGSLRPIHADGAAPMVNLADTAESPQMQRQIVRRHNGQPEDDQRLQPPPLTGDGEEDKPQPISDEEHAPSLKQSDQPPPPPPLLSTGLEDLQRRAAPGAPASMLASALGGGFQLSTPRSGTASCGDLFIWGYEEVSECRDEDSPFKPSKCHCEMDLLTYTARYCNSALKTPMGSDGGVDPKTEENHTGDDGYPVGVPVNEKLYGYGACDKCCVRKHEIAPAATAGLLGLAVLMVLGVMFCGVVFKNMAAKNKEYDEMRKKLDEADAAKAAAETAAAPPDPAPEVAEEAPAAGTT